MTGILDGVRVLDLSTGIAGPITAMLLSDHGAEWCGSRRRIAGPTGRARSSGTAAPAASRSTWPRRTAATRCSTWRRAPTSCWSRSVPPSRPRSASSTPTCGAVNPRLVHTSITAYGRDTAAADRPDVEWLVTARTGLQADQRGWYGTRMDHIMGVDLAEPGFDVPAGADQLGCREGPIFLAVPWASLGAALLATTATSAGLYVVERTGVGQHVETSLAQAVINMNAMGWQRVAADAPELPPVVLRPAGAEGHLPRRRRRVAAPVGAVRAHVPAGQRGGRRPGDGAARSVVAGGDYETSVRAQAEAFVETAAAIATRPRDEWVRARRRGEDRPAADPVAGGGAARRAAGRRGGDRRARRPRARADPPGRPRLRVRRRRSPPIRPRPSAPTDAADVAAGVVAADRRRAHRHRAGRAAGRRARARLRPGHRRTVRSADPRRPRRRR